MKLAMKRLAATVSNIHASFILGLGRSFEKLGKLIANHYWYFIIVPTILTCLGASGLINLVPNNDFDTISLPDHGLWSEERRLVEKYFTPKQKLFSIMRSTKLKQYLNVIIVSKNGNILESNSWNAVLKLHHKITNHVTIDGNKEFNFKMICAKKNGKCPSILIPLRPDKITLLGSYGLQMLEIFKINNLTWPNFTPALKYLIGYNLGKPNFTQKGILQSAESISLYYWLESDTEEQSRRSMAWEKEALRLLSNISDSRLLEVLSHAKRTLSDEMDYANDRVKPLLIFSGLFMVVFVICSAAMRDWVRSKIILSILGIVSVVMATSASFGILNYCQVPFIGINYAAIFLMLGIGIDDMFVLLAVWRITPIQDSVEKRMITTYRHACISVTMTSVTNGLAFLMGTFTNIKIVQIFSIYSCFSIVMTYLYFMTFFGGWMALFATLEKNQRHSIFCCLEVEPKSKSRNKNSCYRWFMSGGIDRLRPHHAADNKPHIGMDLVRKLLGKPLSNKYFRSICLLAYLWYVIVAIYGISKLELQTSPNRISFQNETSRYFEKYDQYYRDKPYPVQVVLTDELDYTNSSVQNRILKLHDTLEHLPVVHNELTISWLKDWIHYVRRSKKISRLQNDRQSFVRFLKEDIQNMEIHNKNMTCKDIWLRIKNATSDVSKSTFTNIRKIIHMLNMKSCSLPDLLSNLVQSKTTMKQPEVITFVNLVTWAFNKIDRFQDMYNLDVVFDDSLNKIKASRFLIFVENSTDVKVQQTLRKVVAECGLPGVKVFNALAISGDEMNLVRETTITSTLSTTLVVIAVSLVFIPSPWCSLWVAFSIASIEIGVVGLMALWNVKLNAVSMVNLIMCIGFSVDFTVHMAYAFLSTSGSAMKDRIETALYSVGVPILLGGLSTIIGITPIYFADSAVFLIFFKVVFIVVNLGMVHALIFLPVFMSLISFEPRKVLEHTSESNQDTITVSTLTISKEIIDPKDASISSITHDNKSDNLSIETPPATQSTSPHLLGTEILINVTTLDEDIFAAKNTFQNPSCNEQPLSYPVTNDTKETYV